MISSYLRKWKGGRKAAFFLVRPLGWVLLSGLILCLSLSVQGQDGKVNILFYNVENLFDTLDTPEKADEEFTPSSILKHNSVRYNEKLSHLAQVVDSSFYGKAPELLGLCEVENRVVVQDLRDHISIEHHLDIIHYESPDQRGIDNALLFDTVQFSPLSSGLAKIDLGEEERPTRGVLWAALKEKHTSQVFVIMVNHWPSRYGGQEESNWKRVKSSDRAIALIDSLRKVYPDCGAILMGDLNDHPDNESVQQLLKCDEQGNGPCFVNMHERYLELDSGSHAYRGEWGVLDHILLDRKLMDFHSWVPGRNQGEFVSFKWMMYEDSRTHELFPSRYYGRDKCFGGYSDHLPARVTIHLP